MQILLLLQQFLMLLLLLLRELLLVVMDVTIAMMIMMMMMMWSCVVNLLTKMIGRRHLVMVIVMKMVLIGALLLVHDCRRCLKIMGVIIALAQVIALSLQRDLLMILFVFMMMVVMVILVVALRISCLGHDLMVYRIVVAASNSVVNVLANSLFSLLLDSQMLLHDLLLAQLLLLPQYQLMLVLKLTLSEIILRPTYIDSAFSYLMNAWLLRDLVMHMIMMLMRMLHILVVLLFSSNGMQR